MVRNVCHTEGRAPALNESWWSNETSIGSGHSGLGGNRGKPSIPNDLAASTNPLLFSWLFASLCTVLLLLLYALLLRLCLSRLFPHPYRSTNHTVWFSSAFEKSEIIRVLDLHIIRNALIIFVRVSSIRWLNVIPVVASFASSFISVVFIVVDVHERTLLIVESIREILSIIQCTC